MLVHLVHGDGALADGVVRLREVVVDEVGRVLVRLGAAALSQHAAHAEPRGAGTCGRGCFNFVKNYLFKNCDENDLS